jgi:hypothetical protein
MAYSENEIEDCLQAYIRTALWSSNDESDERGGEPMDKNYGPDDLSPETLDWMRADVAAFWEKAEDLLMRAECKRHADFTTKVSQAGHDFWLNRNGHGCGFWDGDWIPRELGEALSKLAKSFGECWLLIGDDGKVHHA